MRRLFVLIWLALSLAFASGPAFAMSKADCPMTAAHHMTKQMGKDCCAPDCAPSCATACPTAVMPHPERTAASTLRNALQLAAWTANALPSIEPAGTDPPPRTTFS